MAPIERDLPVCVLGSTPEYRDVLAELGFSRVTVIEAYPAFHAAVAPLRAFTNAEEVVFSTWQAFFTRGGADRMFAAILGHLTIGNVPYEQRDALGEGISWALMKSGIYLEYVLHQQAGFHAPETIQTRFRDAPANLATLNDFNCRAIFLADAVRSEGVVRPGRLAELYALDPNPRLRWLAGRLGVVTPVDGVWYYGKPWAAELRWRERHFSLIQEKADVSGAFAGSASACLYGVAP